MRILLRLLFRVGLRVVAVAVVAIGVLAVVPVPTTSFMLQSWAQRGQRPAYDWTPASAIPPSMLVAVVAAEDQTFDRHHGFDLRAIEQAARHNSRGGSVRGASTISQQVAKNLFLWPGRSWVRKGLEAALTLTIEALWPKRRILEVYVNIAEMGDGVFGVGAASRRWFGVPPRDLTAAQAALLAASLPNPREMRVDDPPPAMLRRQRWILAQMDALGGASWLRRLNASKSASGPP